MHEISVGSIAEWVTAVGALVALLFAARAARAAQRSTDTALRLLGLEEKREGRAEEQRRSLAQASMRAHQADDVAAWVDGVSGGSIAWKVRNASGLPIYDVELMAVNDRSGKIVLTQPEPMLPPGAEQTVQHNPLFQPAAGLVMLLNFTKLPGGRPHYAAAAIRFRDTAGRRWLRNYKGILELESEPSVD